MEKTAKRQARKGKAAESLPPDDTSAQNRTWADLAINGLTRFSRYGWDIAGVLLILCGLLLGLGLAGWSEGILIRPLSDLAWRWFGWGSILFVMLGLAGGVFCIFSQHHPAWKITFGRLVALECAALAVFPLLTLLGGASLERAEAGQDGGLVGWGLVELVRETGLSVDVITGLCAVLIALLVLAGSGLTGVISRWAERTLAEEGLENLPERPVRQPAAPRAPRAAPKGDGPEEAAPAPASPALPPKNLRPDPAPRPKQLAAVEREGEVQPQQRDERLPPLNLMTGEQNVKPDERVINQTAGLIERSLAEFGVPAKVVGYRIGPTVTQYAVEPGFIEKPGPDGAAIHQKVRVSQISTLARDLTLALSAERLRIEAPVPGHSYVGIEVPNARSSVVRLRPILESEAFYKVNSPLAVGLGRDVSGRPVVADLTRMPHLLIAGTTGSGKSVCIAALAVCLAANNTPEDLRLVMIDPKMVELVRFNGLPHILGKVETDQERILGVLRWSLSEMDHRYRLLESAHARDIASYNRKMEKRNAAPLPRIVLIIDELADLMMTAPDQTEHSIVRLAQMARAVGIHLVVATQRPSTDVVTGLIKANFPSRISFTVASSVDSRVILDTTGAETLLGKGDMLFLNPETGTPIRAQGVMVTDQEIERIIQFWMKMSPPAQGEKAPWEDLMNESQEGTDSLIEQAIEVVRGSQRASASLLQRRLRIGYPRAARLIDQLEELGVVGPSQGGGKEREVLVSGGEEEDEEGTEDGG